VNEAVGKFKAIGEPTRLRILRVLLAANQELCVCEIVDTLGKPLYTVSKNLTVLRQAGLVEERRDGKFMMYSLVRGGLNEPLLDSIAALPPHDELYRDDLSNLDRRLERRPELGCRSG
jgi:ArsR family transcriptional regulator